MKKYYKFKLNTLLLNIVSGILCIAAIAGLLIIYKGDFFKNINVGIAYIGLIVYFILHELLHGIGYMLFAKDKKNIKYGAILENGIFYSMCQEEISKSGIIISLLFPIIFLTFIPLPFGIIINNKLIILYSIFNLIGAIGDIVLLKLIFKMPRDIKYIDYDNDIGAYFISKSDLSKIKSFGLTFVESGSNKQINTKIKRLYISNFSIGFVIVTTLLIVISYFIK